MSSNMQKLKSVIQQNPALSCLLIITFCVSLLMVLKVITGDQHLLFNWPRLIVINAITLSTVYFIFKFNWQKSAGLTLSPAKWQNKWLLASLPLLAPALLNLTSIQWQVLEYSSIRLSAWLISNLTTGLFEEIVLRGFCFYVLYKAWGSSGRGLFLAAIFQALIFGVAHLGNLYHTPALDVIAQVIFATLIGFGFAGLVYLTKSLWPAIIIHTCINGVGSINKYFMPDFVANQSPGVSGYIVVVALFLITTTIPGFFYLRKASNDALIHAH